MRLWYLKLPSPLGLGRIARCRAEASPVLGSQAASRIPRLARVRMPPYACIVLIGFDARTFWGISLADATIMRVRFPSRLQVAAPLAGRLDLLGAFPHYAHILYEGMLARLPRFGRSGSRRSRSRGHVPGPDKPGDRVSRAPREPLSGCPRVGPHTTDFLYEDFAGWGVSVEIGKRFDRGQNPWAGEARTPHCSARRPPYHRYPI